MTRRALPLLALVLALPAPWPGGSAAAQSVAPTAGAPTTSASPAASSPTDRRAADGPALVLVVRHAEKADDSSDPPLSAAGRARAEALAEALAQAHVTHVIVSHRQRTRLTAAPLLDARGLVPEVVPFASDFEAHVAAVAAAVRRRAPGEVVLVVGHSNTVPRIVQALGGPAMPDLCDARYAALFAVVPAATAGGAAVVESSFGVADPPSARSCGGMRPH